MGCLEGAHRGAHSGGPNRRSSIGQEEAKPAPSAEQVDAVKGYAPNPASTDGEKPSAIGSVRR
jgi:hypothetical protein